MLLMLPSSPLPRIHATRLGPGSGENAQSKPQIHNLPVAIRIIIEYQKLCYSLFHSARLLPARPFREDAQYKSPVIMLIRQMIQSPPRTCRGSSERFGSTYGRYLDEVSARVISYSRGRCHSAILIRAVLYRVFERGINGES